MKKIFPVALFVFIGSFFSCQQQVKTNESKTEATVSLLHSDPIVKSKKDLPKSLPILFESGENTIAGRILMAQGAEEKPTLIFLHGNPGFEKNEETGQFLRRQGYNTVFFSYTGTWGNKGVFNYSNSIRDLEELVKYLKKNASYFRIDVNKLYLCGHSTGADIAILSGSKLSEIKKIISIDPWDGYSVLNLKTENEINEYAANVEQRPCINVPSGMDFVNGIISDEEMSLTQHLSSGGKDVVHIFSSKKLKSQFLMQHSGLRDEKIIVLNACDHSFSDKRIELAKTVIQCLD